MATAALRKATALFFFSSFITWLKAMREASSMQTWTTPNPGLGRAPAGCSGLCDCP